MSLDSSIDSFSQMSTQNLPGTQEINNCQQLDQTTLEEKSWGMLIPLRNNVEVYNLTKDYNSFGRGNVTHRFRENIVTKQLFLTVSKHHFSIYRVEDPCEGSVVVLEDKSFNGTFINKILIGKDKKKVLCSNDEISVSIPDGKVFVFYDCLNNDANDYPRALSEKYTMTKKLGGGTYGEVRLAYSVDTLQRVAVKIMPKKVLSANGTSVRQNNLNQIKNEIKLLESVDHPCIVKLLDIIEGPQKIYIVMELACGGELFDRISNSLKLQEPIAKMYFYQLVQAVLYLHKHKITHRDIKPENILLDSDDEYARIKLTDFGLSKLTNDVTIMTSLCGTPNYIAPELLLPEEGRRYNSKVDIWSLGVVLFVSLGGYLPFSGKDDHETQCNIRYGRYKMRDLVFGSVSSDAKDLIRKLLVVNPDVRLSAEQILKHRWLQDPKMIAMAEKLMKASSQNLAPQKRPHEDSAEDITNNKTPKVAAGIIEFYHDM